MKKKSIKFLILVSCILHLASCICFGAFEEKGEGARPLGMSGAFTAISDDASAVFFNPAGLGQLKNIEATSMYTRLFWMRHLPYYLESFVFPVEKLNSSFGLSHSQFGPKNYKETQLVFSHGACIRRGSYLGYNIRNMRLRITGGGGINFFTWDLGALAFFGKKVSLGVMMTNLGNSNLGKTPEKLPRAVKGGFCYRFTPGTFFTADFIKRTGPMAADLEIKVGVETEIIDGFLIRGGVQNKPARFSFGFGARQKIFKIDYAFFSHPVLSGQHQFSVGVKLEKFKKAKKERERPPEARSEFKEGIKEEDVVIIIEEEEPFEETELPEAEMEKEEKGEEVFSEEVEEAVEEPGEEESEEVEKININEAPLKELKTLPGITSVAAKNIIRYRKRYGKVKKIEDLMRIPGIDRKKFEKIKDFIFVE